LDFHLDAPKPFVSVRASTTKNKTRATIPLIPDLANSIRRLRDQQESAAGKVFRNGVPKAKTLRRDLEACGIPYLDEIGRRLDFHALRHTFGTLLNLWGITPRTAMELMRHSDILTMKTYMDSTSLPLFNEMDKLPSPIASPKSDKPSQNVGKPVQAELELKSVKIVDFRGETEVLAKAVPDWENLKVAEREGFEPFYRREAKSRAFADFVDF
jgi:Phage integrase family